MSLSVYTDFLEVNLEAEKAAVETFSSTNSKVRLPTTDTIGTEMHIE